eukprot:236085-Rhodomonas_salina.3
MGRYRSVLRKVGGGHLVPHPDHVVLFEVSPEGRVRLPHAWHPTSQGQGQTVYNRTQSKRHGVGRNSGMGHDSTGHGVARSMLYQAWRKAYRIRGACSGATRGGCGRSG